MRCFNTIKKLIVAPALVITLTAGSVMAGPGQHFDVKAHHSARMGQSSMFENGARHSVDIGTAYSGDIATQTTNSSSLGATQNANTPLGSAGGITFYFLEVPEFDFDAQSLMNILDIHPKRELCEKVGC